MRQISPHHCDGWDFAQLPLPTTTHAAPQSPQVGIVISPPDTSITSLLPHNLPKRQLGTVLRVIGGATRQVGNELLGPIDVVINPVLPDTPEDIFDKKVKRQDVFLEGWLEELSHLLPDGVKSERVGLVVAPGGGSLLEHLGLEEGREIENRQLGKVLKVVTAGVGEVTGTGTVGEVIDVTVRPVGGDREGDREGDWIGWGH
ncbi:hypothetical protein B0T21DRAFT_352022 [Apiosordaria backusii]|uniref:Uncharacterized protein n=1 Tax=Apiosordaria backusii TaxID=314023 RepID=A0AA40AIR5_9PEZI|nr:hypothetical protein B0T21DRAFT_352022 [Apiosordaria backusii]